MYLCTITDPCKMHVLRFSSERKIGISPSERKTVFHPVPVKEKRYFTPRNENVYFPV